MNFVTIIGRLGRDPETRYTADGTKVTVLIVAANYRKGGQDETIWYRVTLWGDKWDKMMQHFSKGKPIIVGGEMRKPEIYTDKNGLQQVGSIEVTADYVKFLPFTKPESSEEQPASGHAPQHRHQAPASESGYSDFQQRQPTLAHHGTASTNPGLGREESEEEPLPF